MVAARSSSWLIVENLHMLPDSVAPRFLKFMYDGIVYSEKTFEGVKIWLTYFIDQGETYQPLNISAKTFSNLQHLTKDCFKLNKHYM